MDRTKMYKTKNEQYIAIAEEIYVDSCGRKGLGETPQCEAQGGSPAARGKRSIFPERVICSN
ncbi:hypothetical protein E4U82_14270 [Lentibacillus salicampi]|uniref:Uncharacterized protein n=1 Tax=Lentibacillus salicampi TaxID=175306 RepID=A0A4Y9AAV0_9BACI|nr:hypothetical protein E4U82_14270 [Lentibacillus salicampi]